MNYKSSTCKISIIDCMLHFYILFKQQTTPDTRYLLVKHTSQNYLAYLLVLYTQIQTSMNNQRTCLVSSFICIDYMFGHKYKQV